MLAASKQKPGTRVPVYDCRLPLGAILPRWCAVTHEKVERYMGRAVACVVAAFCAFCKAAADRAVDYGAFERELVMHM